MKTLLTLQLTIFILVAVGFLMKKDTYHRSSGTEEYQ